MKARFPLLRILFVILALFAPSVLAQDGLGGALSRWRQTTGFIRAPFEHGLIAADFDNDNRLDGAVLLDTGQAGGLKTFRIELHLTTGRNSQLTFASNEPELAISALDVNQDGVPDIVVEQALTHKRLHIWLNDGHGRFRKTQLNDFPNANDDKGALFESPSPLGAVPTLYLPSKIGFELAILRNASPRSDGLASLRYARPPTSAAGSAVEAPNPPRAPPSFTNL
jgi:hypothetical protein